MKNIRITFRLSPYQLARGLQTIKQLDPTYELTSINDMVKTIYHDYLAKMTLNKTSSVPMNYVVEINAHTERESEKLTLENMFLNHKKSPIPSEEIFSAKPAIKEEELITIESTSIKENHSNSSKPSDEDSYDPTEELSDETLAEIEELMKQTNKFKTIIKSSEFIDPNLTESEISTLTDFSPPKDWMD